jgi:hypothetical protein
MTELRAFQIEVTSRSDDSHQIFYVAAATAEAAIAALTGYSDLLPEPTFKLQRRLSDSEIDLYQIGPDTIFPFL